MVVVLLEGELRALELFRHGGEPGEQRLAARDHQRGVAAQHLRLAGRQVELAAPDIHPHVGVGRHHVRVARQPEPRHIEQLRQPLVRDLDVDVLEMDRVAEVLGGAVELLVHWCVSELRERPIVAWPVPAQIDRISPREFRRQLPFSPCRM
jgi:hypothetical protein